jgi:formate hydrogenlyase transcriptional activator
VLWAFADSHVANQVAVAVENALAFQEIHALSDQLAKEKIYLEEEARTEHNFRDIVGGSAALRRVLPAMLHNNPLSMSLLLRLLGNK